MDAPSSTSNSKELRKFLLRIILPLAVGAVVVLGVFDYVTTNYLVFSQPMNGAQKINQAVSIADPNQVGIFGSSRASGSYITTTIHPDAWNYGIEFSQYRLMEIMLRAYLKGPGDRPVVVNLDYEIYQNWKGSEANYVPNLSISGVEDLLGKQYHWTHRVPGLRYFGIVDDYAKTQLASIRRRHPIDRGGFYLDVVVPPKEFAKLAAARAAKVNRFHFDALRHRRFLKMIQRHPDREFYMVVAPYHSSYYAQFEGEEYYQIFKRTLAAQPNVHFFDYRHDFYPDSLWHNTTHLTYEGAKIFSARLRADLLDRGFPPD